MNVAGLIDSISAFMALRSYNHISKWLIFSELELNLQIDYQFQGIIQTTWVRRKQKIDLEKINIR